MSDLSDLAKLEYVARVDRAIDHIVGNPRRSHRLEYVARVAGFSPFHFHRIFKGIVGETLGNFVKRVRLERALYLLAHREGTSLTAIAFACGFSSSSDFSRSFRAHHGVSPRNFDIDAFRKTRRHELQASGPLDPFHRLERLAVGENPDGFSVRLREVPPRRVAYLRVFRPFEGGRVPDAARRLVGWARRRGLAGAQWLGYMWEDPEIVALDKCRYDVAVEVPAHTRGEADVGTADFAAMKLAEVDVVGDLALEQRALDWLYLTWLPRSGFAPDHQPCFEAWNGEPFALGSSRFELRVQLPVVSASEPL